MRSAALAVLAGCGASAPRAAPENHVPPGPAKPDLWDLRADHPETIAALLARYPDGDVDAVTDGAATQRLAIARGGVEVDVYFRDAHAPFLWFETGGDDVCADGVCMLDDRDVGGCPSRVRHGEFETTYRYTCRIGRGVLAIVESEHQSGEDARVIGFVWLAPGVSPSAYDSSR